MPQDPDVGFTVKELFLDIKGEIKSLREHVDVQQQVEMEKLDAVVDRVTQLETHAATSTAVEASSRAMGRLALAVSISILGMIINVVVTYLHK